MKESYYFNTGIAGKDAIEISFYYSKDAGGYVACINVGDRRTGMFGWHIDADYFKYYRKHQFRVIVPCGRRSAKNEQLARQLFDANVNSYAQEFAAACEQDGAPHMEISAA